jgi:hypothetical protein
VLTIQDQPDVLKLHVQYLRSCERCESTINITPLRVGTLVSTLQLQLSQKGKIKAVAIATSTNFGKPVGPTASPVFALLPPTKPVPKLDLIAAQKPEPHWLLVTLAGEVTPFTGRLLSLNPRGGHIIDGVCDAWNSFIEHEHMGATHLTLMTDIIPSMSDILLRNGGLYDAHAFYEKMERWAEQNPGTTAPLTNSIAEAMRSSTLNTTISHDVEFKQRLPEQGLEWLFTRTATKVLRDGRMDIDITMCNQKMELVCQARQLVLVLEAHRKFRGGKEEPAL